MAGKIAGIHTVDDAWGDVAGEMVKGAEIKLIHNERAEVWIALELEGEGYGEDDGGEYLGTLNLQFTPEGFGVLLKKLNALAELQANKRAQFERLPKGDGPTAEAAAKGGA